MSSCTSPYSQAYFRYWGKTDRAPNALAPYHLLCFHSLDVAACGLRLISSRRFSLAPLALELGWDTGVLEESFLVLLALHDAGKFSRAFQGLAPDLSPELVPRDPKKHYSLRHDTLGWLLLSDCLLKKPVKLPGEQDFWEDLFRIVTGHHGRPPVEQVGGHGLRLAPYFLEEDRAAGVAFADDLMALLKTHPWPAPEKRHIAILKRHSYRLAGLCVLADWLGSRQSDFAFRTEPLDLRDYWNSILPSASVVVAAAGLTDQPLRPWSTPAALLPTVKQLTPLQQYAATVELSCHKQMFLLEDVTGSGKTEAALLLCHRLLAAGRASGVYFAMPTMATANQMYKRVGDVYRRLFADEATPSLVLAHGARDLIVAFRQSILPFDDQNALSTYCEDEPTAAAQCSAWLADSRKKSMLADVGVGTIDQALQAILPERHQSLRLLGLSDKILVVDEVHAYDSYTGTLLLNLLEAHGQAGGSAILLSATVPTALRARIIAAFQGPEHATKVQPDARYPLATHAIRGEVIQTFACATRAEVARTVGVAFVHKEVDALERIIELSRSGRCVCWVRNTVHDARLAYQALRGRLEEGTLTLFHSRFALGDRLAREAGVVARFGPESTSADRHGQVLVATQVVEQSLDLDFDEMMTDLAPVDLIVQRAGRLRRHLRHNDGSRMMTGQDDRGAGTLHVLAPQFQDDPDRDWYSALLPKAACVYEDTGTLWRTMAALWGSRCIVSPGLPKEPGGVRNLIEAVYAETGGAYRPLPKGLLAAERKTSGAHMGNRSQAEFNTLDLNMGYCEAAGDWEHTKPTPTRLGDDTGILYLARVGSDGLEAFLPEGQYPWEMSAVRVRTQDLQLSAGCRKQFGEALNALRGKVPLLADEHVLILPLIEEGEGWSAEVEVKAGSAYGVVEARYSMELGLEIDR